MSALVAAIGGRAEAQPVYHWTGFYIGGNAGAAWGHSDFATDAPCVAATFLPGYFCTATFSQANGSAVAAAGTGSASSTKFTGGGQIGYNQQFGTWVAGVEGDLGAFGIRARKSTTAAYPSFGGPFAPGTPFTLGTEAGTDWLLTLRGRVGATFSNTLLYVTGGLAVSRVTLNTSYTDTVDPCCNATGAATAKELKAGFAVGAGAEFKLTRNWGAKFEYLYVDLGSVSATTVIAGNGYSQAINTKADVTANIARVGINYQY